MPKNFDVVPASTKRPAPDLYFAFRTVYHRRVTSTETICDDSFKRNGKGTMIKQLCGLAIFSIVALVVMGPVGNATVLPPGTCAGNGCVPPVYDDFPTADFFGAPILGDTGIEAFTGTDAFGNVVFTGKFREIVITDNITGHLDFLYQIQRTGGTDSLGRLTTINYKSVITDVGQCSACSPVGDLIAAVGPLHVAPQFVGRGVSGDTVIFDFGGTVATQIGDSNESSILVIRTDATRFIGGSSSIIDGGVTSVASLAPAPEPGLVGLLLGGLFAVGLVFARRYRVS